MRWIWVVVLVACSSERSASPPTPASSSAPVARVPSGEATSTIAGADYIGPDACGECHPVQHAQWMTSLHRTMNQRAVKDEVIGQPGTLAYDGGMMIVARDERGTTMTLRTGESETRYRITRTIGTRHLQEYVGVEDGKTDEVRLPFAWWRKGQGWFPQPYFDPWFAKEADFHAYAPLTEPWAQRCPWCHSTYPFAQRIARASAKNVGHGFEQFFTATAGSDRLAVDQQVTTGISCESCHLGGRAHRDGAPMHFVPIGATAKPGAPAPTTFTAERADATVVNRVCAQCHSGPSPRLANGTALRNSSEALDLAASSCTARCTECHDPHTGGSDEQRAIAACTTCHAQLANPEASRVHSGHDATTSCLDCHMPKLVMGIDRVVRTHRISSPTDSTIYAMAGPQACNLCHVDRSLAWTLDELARRWDVTLSGRGDLETPMGEVWLASKEPALRLLAADALAKSGIAKLSLPRLIGHLNDPLPHLRAWTWFSVQAAAASISRPVAPQDFDPRAPTEQRLAQIERLRTYLSRDRRP